FFEPTRTFGSVPTASPFWWLRGSPSWSMRAVTVNSPSNGPFWNGMSAAESSKASGNFVAGSFLTAIIIPRALGLSEIRRATTNSVPSGFFFAAAPASSILPLMVPPSPAAGAAAAPSGAGGGGAGGGGGGGSGGGATAGAGAVCDSGGTPDGAPASSF